ncbi:Ferredoxin [Pseudonocardia ammonioxydans]|uniref:Ferredoxin n=1 Tax=Pseudonocardia ammonioxydans TaxID=260086 RepID=A0A1I5FXE4_PSUAM|nr:ferredoxin [Pseudonocardia ammonioxydans]SFO28427.1 Ferredoxin [Pseudonocardia ammonioxydans]
MLNVGADYDKCEGYANCILAAPDVFDVNDDGVVVVLRDAVEESERERVGESVRACPVSALKLDPASH